MGGHQFGKLENVKDSGRTENSQRGNAPRFVKDGYFNCWRCGWKPADKALAALLSISEGEARPRLED